MTDDIGIIQKVLQRYCCDCEECRALADPFAALDRLAAERQPSEHPDKVRLDWLEKQGETLGMQDYRAVGSGSSRTSAAHRGAGGAARNEVSGMRGASSPVTQG